MNTLSYLITNKNDFFKIDYIYDILNECGEDMYHQYGLVHWLNPYPKEAIRLDCENNDVYLVYNCDIPVATFQLSEQILKGKQTIHINKFATRPIYSNRGIGKSMMKFVTDKSLEKNIGWISLDVYTESLHAIEFYKNLGFEIIEKKPTKRFAVYKMMKNIDR